MGITAALGPMAINFGVSVGGGETMLIPYVASLGGSKLFWIMTLSCIFETFLVYECIKYTMLTGRSFFSMTRDIPPRGFWPWFWGAYSILCYVWPSWLAGSASAMFKLTGWGTFYLWCVAAFVLVILVFAFSRHIYKALSTIFTFVMIVNLVCVVIIAALVATPKDYLDVLWGYFNFGLAGYPKGFQMDFSSIPRLPIVFTIFGDRAHREGVVHDFLYRKDSCPVVTFQQANQVFLEAMKSRHKSRGIRYPMYWAVCAFAGRYFHKHRVGDKLYKGVAG
jgi:hypothetical protein